MLMPGLALTTAMNEVATGHLVSGTARFAGACGVTRRVALRVTDRFGLQHTSFGDVNVLCNQPPVIVLDPNPARVDEGDQLVIDASGTSDPEGNAFQLDRALLTGFPALRATNSPCPSRVSTLPSFTATTPRVRV